MQKYITDRKQIRMGDTTCTFNETKASLSSSLSDILAFGCQPH